MANQVDYRNPTPNKFPQDYDPAKVDPRVKLRSDSIKHKMFGVDTREAMYQALEIGAVTAGEAKSTADKIVDSQDNLNQRVDDQIAANTIKNEEIDFRHSDMLKKTFDTMRLRGDFYDHELASRGINVKWFGAVGDGVTDDTDAIQAAFDYFKKSDVRTIIAEGDFLLSDRGVDEDARRFAVKIDGLEGKNFDFSRAKFVTGKVDGIPNLFAIYNCSNITIKGGVAEANTGGLVTGTTLYNGAFFYAKKCSDLNIGQSKAINMGYLACIFDSDKGSVVDTVFTHTQQEAERNLRPFSAILLYGSSRFKVTGNDINGGLRDGDLSVFGSAATNNMVAYNHLRASVNWEEAITVDGGAVKTVVTNNIIEGGYNYGIESKYNSEHTLISNNSISRCVVGISIRGGEIGEAPVFEPVIQGNTIIFGDVPDGRGWGDARQTGIYSTSTFNANITGNHLTLGLGDVDYVIRGIYVTPIHSESLDYYSPFKIDNNYVELQNGTGGSFKTAGVGSTGLTIDKMTKAQVLNNTFKAPGGLLAVKLLGNNGTIMFTANTFQTGIVTPIQYYGDAACNELIISDDNLADVTKIANAYMWSTNVGQDHRTMLINNKKLTGTELNPFLQLTTQTGGSLIVKIRMTYDNAGTFIVDSSYRVYVTTDWMTVTPISESNTDVTVAEMGISANKFAIGFKANRALAVEDVHLHVDVFSQSLDQIVFS